MQKFQVGRVSNLLCQDCFFSVLGAGLLVRIVFFLLLFFLVLGGGSLLEGVIRSPWIFF